jgi:hypothetical protein
MAGAPEEGGAGTLCWTEPEVETFPEAARGQKVFIVAALHCGNADVGERLLRPLRKLDDPVLDLSVRAPYKEVQTLFDPFFLSSEQRYYWKSLRLDRLDHEVMDAVIGHARRRPSPATIVPIWHHGGAMARVGPEETAFGDRSAPYLLSLDSTWTDPADDDVNVAWTRQVWQDMQRFSSRGAYLNFPGMGEEADDLVRSAYGRTYERLASIKAEYDSTNFFRVNQNVEPTASEPALPGKAT